MNYRLHPTVAQIDRAVGRVDPEPSADTLPRAPEGFTNAEVAALAERAIDVVNRGIEPSLSEMSPAAAFNYVFANQYPATTDSSRQATKAAAGRFDWEWAWASRFETAPSIPARFLTSRWQVETETQPLGDGTTKEMLRVVLSVSIEHLVPTTPGDADAESPSGDPLMRPIVMQRKVIVQGFKPLGGEKWWPGVGVQATPLFGGKCAPTNGSVLTPATFPKTLRRDLERLTDYVDHPGEVETSNVSDSSDLAAFVEEYCED